MQTRISALLLSFILVPVVACGQTAMFESARHDYRAVPVAAGLSNPWSLAFLPSGDLLITEKEGRLRLVRDGELVETPISGVPPVYSRGQGGLLDVLPHPDFESNRLIYMSYSKPMEEGATTAVMRGRLVQDRLEDVEDIFVADSRGGGHYGSRLAFDADGYLFITVGDRMASPTGDLAAHPAQDLSNHHGTVNRIHDDGRIPEDNPFVGRPDARPEIWSYGHRNPQGLFIDQETGNIWLNEHGPRGGDELNLIKRGANFGWPIVGHGINYNGQPIHEATSREGMEDPVHFWVPSIATSGMLHYTGDQFPEWQGNLFVGGLVGQQLARLTMDGTRVADEETLFAGQGRIRDIEQGPDGFIYLAIDTDGGPRTVLRLEPM